MAEIERVDIIKLTISNKEFEIIKKALGDRARGYCDATSAEEDEALGLLEEINGK